MDVTIDELFMISTDGKLYGYGNNAYGVFDQDTRGQTMMRQINLNIPQSYQLVDVKHSYCASYLIFEKLVHKLDLFKKWKRGSFYDVVLL
jgi:alpha-tubulin suppressor-like RCC1 family protein